MTLTTSDTAVTQQDTIGVVEEKAKVCADCMHLIGVRYKIDEAEEKWKCGHPTNTQEWQVNLVTGMKYRIFVIKEIKRVRYEVCKGNLWELYVPPAPKDTNSIGGSIPVEFTDEDMEQNREAATKRVEEIKNRRNKKLTDKDLGSL